MLDLDPRLPPLTLPRPRPLPPPRPRPVVLAAVALTVLALVAADSRTGRAHDPASYPDGSMAVLGDQFAPPPVPTEEPVAEPGGSGDRPARISSGPDWEFDLPDGVDRPKRVAATADGYVLMMWDPLVAVDANGERRWEYELTSSRDQVSVGREVVLVSHDHPTDDRWPRPEVIVALDPVTGETLWEEDEASFWTAFEDVVYLSVCRGGQNGRIGDCQLSARDPRTNTVRWSVPTYASARVLGGRRQLGDLPPYLVVESFPTGHESRTISTLDPDSGRALGAGFQGYSGTLATPDTLIQVDDYDENPADGCTAELTGHAVQSGELVWTYESQTSKGDDGILCDDLPDQAAGGYLAVTSVDGVPEVLDTATGEIVWTGPRSGRGLAATPRLAVAIEPADGPAELVVYDLPGGRQRWRVPAPPTAGVPEVTVFGEMFLTYYLTSDYTDAPAGYDLATGEAWSYGVDDGRGTEGSGWVVVCGEATCRGFDLR